MLTPARSESFRGFARRPRGRTRAGRPRLARDGSGNALTHNDFNGNTTTVEYDGANRPTKMTYDVRNRMVSDAKASGGTIAYTYDVAGNLTSVTDPDGTVTYTYDVLDRLATVVATTGTTTYGYDDVGNLTSVVHPNGTSTTYAYDALNRLTSMTNSGPGGTFSSYTYTLDPAGRRTQVVKAGSATTGRVVHYTYDDVNRLTIEDIDESGTADDRTITYTYDDVGNRLTKGVVQGTTTTTVVYTHDDNDRLTSEASTVMMSSFRSSHGARIVVASFGLSPSAALVVSLGMWSRRRRSLSRRGRRRLLLRLVVVMLLVPGVIFTPTIAHAGPVQFFSPRPAGAQTVIGTVTYSYDDNGNLTSRTHAADTDTYTYDFEKHLLSADVQIGSSPGLVTFAYNADGARVSRTAGGVTTTYLVDENRDLSQVLVETTGGVSTRYTYANDDLLHLAKPGLGTRFYHRDGQNSTRQLTDETGTVTDGYTYDAFGELLASSGATPNLHQYGGQQLDPNLGFYYLRARWYAQRWAGSRAWIRSGAASTTPCRSTGISTRTRTP